MAQNNLNSGYCQWGILMNKRIRVDQITIDENCPRLVTEFSKFRNSLIIDRWRKFSRCKELSKTIDNLIITELILLI